MRRSLVLLAASTLVLGAAAAQAMQQEAPEQPAAQAPATAIDSALKPVLAPVLADARRAEDQPRDEWRHPAETLAFFQVRPGMTVVDYMPAGGWYTRVLVPYLGEQGRYIGLNPDVSNGTPRQQQSMGSLGEKLSERTAEWTATGMAPVVGYNANTLPPELDGTVDRVLVFREMHNMHRFGWLHDDLLAMRRLLKDDGMLGIVQHRANADAPYAYADGSKGYLREKDVIALVEAHGFELVGKSEINANPADPANHAIGVWALPPSLAGEDDAAMTQIGESDRMTLLFRKRA